MNFTSLSYYLFLPVSAALYFALPARWRTPLLLLCSYFFYACWNPWYAGLLLACTAVTYLCARGMAGRSAGGRKGVLAIGAALVLGVLFFFKYINFSLSLLGREPLHILLPVGISFFTFQAVGYLVDVYRGTVPAEKSFLHYALFVSFFPQLASGPIGRAGHLLPQLKETGRRLSLPGVFDGVLLMLWGLFKKLVIADRLAVLVGFAFAAERGALTGMQYLIAACAFSVQLYCDFSAYTDLARGSAALFGVELMRNFAAPFLAESIQDFWRRWHISLSTWFRDYLYRPLGGNRASRMRVCANVMLVFLVSGLWHGAAFTFLLWGALHGGYQICSLLTRSLRRRGLTALRIPHDHTLLRVLRVGFTFLLVSLAFVFFRAESLSQGGYIIGQIFTNLLPNGLHTGVTHLGLEVRYLAVVTAAVTGMLVVEWAALKGGLVRRVTAGPFVRYGVYWALILVILIAGCYGPGFDASSFLYFQF